MGKVYDDWERLLAAVFKREELKRLALCSSLSSSASVSASHSSSENSFDASLQQLNVDRISGTIVPHAVFSCSSIPSYRNTRPMLLRDLKKATKNFSFMSGNGGFDAIYKGWLHEHTLTPAKPGYGIAVAVKKWTPDNLEYRREEWLAEIKYLNQLRHVNLIKLIAYCSEEDTLLLVYEFMDKGSLDNHLFQRGHISLPWATRVKVANGVARALAFLHNREIPVIHRGLIAADILLDKEFNAKLSGIGLARDGPIGEMTHVSTRVMGRSGLAAPEYVSTGHLTTKCDVYGFGVVLLELLSGRRVKIMDDEQKLERWGAKALPLLLDPKLEGQCPKSEGYAVITLISQCLSRDPNLRPRMDEVLVVLELL